LDIWSGGATQDYDLLWVFECLAYFSVKDDKLNLRVYVLGVKRNLNGYKLWDSEIRKSCLSRYDTFDDASLLMSTVSQEVEKMKTKDVS